MISAFRPAVSDIVWPFAWLLTAGAARQPGQVEYALGDDFAVVDLGKGHEQARCRDIDRAADNGSVPSAQQNGLASLQPGRVGPAGGARLGVRAPPSIPCPPPPLSHTPSSRSSEIMSPGPNGPTAVRRSAQTWPKVPS